MNRGMDTSGGWARRHLAAESGGWAQWFVAVVAGGWARRFLAADTSAHLNLAIHILWPHRLHIEPNSPKPNV